MTAQNAVKGMEQAILKAQGELAMSQGFVNLKESIIAAKDKEL